MKKHLFMGLIILTMCWLLTPSYTLRCRQSGCSREAQRGSDYCYMHCWDGNHFKGNGKRYAISIAKESYDEDSGFELCIGDDFYPIDEEAYDVIKTILDVDDDSKVT